MMVRDTTHIFFGREKKKKINTGEQYLLRSGGVQVQFFSAPKDSEELLVIAGWERVLAPSEASFKTTWLGEIGDRCCYPLTPKEEELIIV